MRRLSDVATGRLLVVPMDHGLTVGPIDGLHDVAARVSEVDSGGATAVVLHKGLVPAYAKAAPRRAGLLVHISASMTQFADPNRKVIVASVEECLRLGADGVSVHVNVGSPTTHDMLSDAGAVADDCHSMGVPLLVMVYPRGEGVEDPFDPDTVAHCARAAEEVGADVVKTYYTGDAESFRTVTRAVRVPVITAGGPPSEDPLGPLAAARGTIDAGGAGVACGRNVFGHPDPEAITRALAAVILGDADPAEAAREHLGG